MNATSPIRWGIIGPGAIAEDIALGMAGAHNATLGAVASRDPARAEAFVTSFGGSTTRVHASYAALVADPDIDAIYVATPHTFHLEHSLLALSAGKAVLCEKPAGVNTQEVCKLTDAAQQHGCFFMEAYMYLFHPQFARLAEVIKSGEMGHVLHVDASFGFNADVDPTSRLFDKTLAGGGILDVGGYPISMARHVAGLVSGQGFAEPTELVGVGHIGSTGVDERAFALLTFDSGMTAECRCAVRLEMPNQVTVTGDKGRITLHDPWIPGRESKSVVATALTIEIGDESKTETIKPDKYLYSYEVEQASAAIQAGQLAGGTPAMSWQQSIDNARVLERWRQALDQSLD